jgi:hypothetical protein
MRDVSNVVVLVVIDENPTPRLHGYHVLGSGFNAGEKGAKNEAKWLGRWSKLIGRGECKLDGSFSTINRRLLFATPVNYGDSVSLIQLRRER